jgi:hypothetical protein
VVPWHRARIFGSRGYRPCGADKTIPAAEFGPDKLAVLAESLAQSADLNLETGRVHKNARPNKGQQFVLCDKRAVGVDKNHQEIERASAEFDRYTIGEQLPAPRQYAETAELERRVSRGRARVISQNSRILPAGRLALLSSYDRLQLHDPVPPLSVRSSN